MYVLEHQRWTIAACAATAAIAIAAVAAWTFGAGKRDAEIALALTGGNAERAPPLLRRYGCGGCHEIPGIPGADGKTGPPLGQFRQRVFIGGTLPNNADNLVKWIVRPNVFHPGSAMPETGLSESEARDVAAYLYGQ
jgi:cytochrome c1